MNRRKLIGAFAAGAALPLLNQVASSQPSPKTKNVVFVHGLFADGSSWSKIIPRLQEKGINCTSVQNPLTSLQEASDAARRGIAAQPGPTVLVGHSFSGMIVTEVGVDPKITALVYVAARAPDAGEDYTALAIRWSRGRAALAAAAPINVRRFMTVSYRATDDCAAFRNRQTKGHYRR